MEEFIENMSSQDAYKLLKDVEYLLNNKHKPNGKIMDSFEPTSEYIQTLDFKGLKDIEDFITWHHWASILESFREHLTTLSRPELLDVLLMIREFPDNYDPGCFPINDFSSIKEFLSSTACRNLNIEDDIYEILDDLSESSESSESIDLTNRCENCMVKHETDELCCGHCLECRLEMGLNVDLVCAICGDDKHGWELTLERADSEYNALFNRGRIDAFNGQKRSMYLDDCYNSGYEIYTKLLEMKKSVDSNDLKAVKEILDELLK